MSQRDYIDFVRQAQRTSACPCLAALLAATAEAEGEGPAEDRGVARGLREVLRGNDGALGSVGLIASVLATEDGEENLRQARSAEALASDPSVVGYAVMGWAWASPGV